MAIEIVDFHGFSHQKWWLSIVMLVYQRVCSLLWVLKIWSHRLIDPNDSGRNGKSWIPPNPYDIFVRHNWVQPIFTRCLLDMIISYHHYVPLLYCYIMLWIVVVIGMTCNDNNHYHWILEYYCWISSDMILLLLYPSISISLKNVGFIPHCLLDIQGCSQYPSKVMSQDH